MTRVFDVTAVRFTNELLVAPAIGKTNRDTDSSIGAPMLAEFDVLISGNDEDASLAKFQGTILTLLPGLFLPAATSRVPFNPGRGFMCSVPTTATAGDILPMEMFTGTTWEASNTNLSCELEIFTDQFATIRLRFIMTMDLNAYLSGSLIDNRNRLVRPSVLSTVDGLLGSQASVYRTTSRHLAISLEMENHLTIEEAKEFSWPFKSRFYLYGLPDNTSSPPLGEATGAGYGFQTEMYRNGVLVDDLSAWQDTEIHFYFPDTLNYAIEDKFMVYLADITPGDNTTTFLEQAGTNGVIIDQGVVVADQDMGDNLKITSDGLAYESVTYDALASKRIKFLATAGLDPARTYAVILVVAVTPLLVDTDNTLTNSFIISNLPANGLPAAVQFEEGDWVGTLLDYNTDAIFDNAISTVVDNVVSRVTINAGSYDAAAIATLPALATTWAEDLRQIIVRLYDDDTDELFSVQTFVRDGAGWSGTSPNEVKETDNGGGSISYALIIHNGFLNTGGFPDFGGRAIKVRWSFQTVYPAAQWYVNYDYYQRLAVNDYANFNEVIASIDLFDYETGSPLQTLCATDQVLVRVLLDPAKLDGFDWSIRAYWTLEPHGYPSNATLRPGLVNEEETYDGVEPLLPALNDSSIALLPAAFVDNQALFVFDHALVPVGQRARLHVIAEPTVVTSISDPGFATGGLNNVVLHTRVRADGRIWVGGTFTAYGATAVPYFALLNVDGSLNTAFNTGMGTGPNDVVRRFTIDSIGRAVIVGSFTSFNGVSRSRIARINIDGTLDLTFDPGAGFNGTLVDDVAILADGTIVAVGDFTTYDGTGANRIVGLQTDGNIEAGFVYGSGFNSAAERIAIDPTDGSVLVSSRFFSTYNGNTVRFGSGVGTIVRLSDVGAFVAVVALSTDPTNKQFNGSIRGIVVRPNGKILVTGEFTNYDGTAVGCIAQLNTDGTLDTTFMTGVGAGFNDWTMQAIILPTGKAVIGIYFAATTTFGGVNVKGLARLNVNGTLDVLFNSGSGFNGTTYTVAYDSGEVIAAGNFLNVDGASRIRVARII